MTTLPILLLAGLLQLAPVVTFAPAPNATTIVHIDGPVVTLATTTPAGTHRQAIPFDSERPLHVVVDDYDFDGHPDVAVWHIDDSMGVHMVYRIFVFVARRGEFVELTPACGDEFLNVQRLAKRKALQNSYFKDNLVVACFHRY